MNYINEQKKEISTIKERQFAIKLSDADVERLYKKSGTAGLTPEELLENFVGDLVCGTYTNGSDERMYAEQWFDRCGFSLGEKKSFLGYILYWGYYDDASELLDDIDETKSDIAALDENDKEYDEDKEFFEAIIDERQQELDDYFEEYCDSNLNHGSYSDEIQKVTEFRKKLNAVLGKKV